jgi:methyl coenzyme M reductase beta subunit
VGTISGAIWYASGQASIIEALQSDLETLTIENNATDRTNLIRDVEENTEQIAEIIEYIIEVEEDGGETIEKIYTTIDDLEDQLNSEFEDVFETQEGFLLQFNQIIKLQARIKTLENTMEYLTRRPMNSDGM